MQNSQLRPVTECICFHKIRSEDIGNVLTVTLGLSKMSQNMFHMFSTIPRDLTQ
jgi:hypothetical protein